MGARFDALRNKTGAPFSCHFYSTVSCLEFEHSAMLVRLVGQLTIAFASANSRAPHAILRQLGALDPKEPAAAAVLRKEKVTPEVEDGLWHSARLRTNHTGTANANWWAGCLSPDPDTMMQHLTAVIGDFSLAVQMGGCSNGPQPNPYAALRGALKDKEGPFTMDKALALLKNWEPSIRAYMWYVSAKETRSPHDVVSARLCMPSSTNLDRGQYKHLAELFDTFLLNDLTERRWPQETGRRWFPYDHIVAYTLRIAQPCESGFRVLEALPCTMAMKEEVVKGFARAGPTMPPFALDGGSVGSGAEVLRLMRLSREGRPLNAHEMASARRAAESTNRSNLTYEEQIGEVQDEYEYPPGHRW
jgi:hypothetical protein